MATGKDSEPQEVQALVIDSNATSRSILVAQLREYGVTKVVQCSRVRDARSRLEHTVFDYVLCDQFFGESNYSGQTLLDDLRRAQLLPFSTVFFMVTTEATYAAVAEAAESALDGYLLKPFTPSALFERLSLARLRKVHLKPIFDAIEQDDFKLAASLCAERFEARQPYWLYAARIGTELLLRLGRHAQARTLFEAVIAARALPWAKLGVARAQIESGQAARAITTLQGLLGEDASGPTVADRLPGVWSMAQAHGLKVGSIGDLIAYRRRYDHLVSYRGQTELDRRQSTEFSDRFCSFANIRRATSPQSADFRRASPPLPNPIAQEVERHG